MGKNKRGEHIMTCNCHFTSNKTEYVDRAHYNATEDALTTAQSRIKELEEQSQRNCDQACEARNKLEAAEIANAVLQAKLEKYYGALDRIFKYESLDSFSFKEASSVLYPDGAELSAASIGKG